jgi:hypothetical protein
VIKELAVSGLPILRWVEKMVPDGLTTRQAEATRANDRQKFEEETIVHISRNG